MVVPEELIIFLRARLDEEQIEAEQQDDSEDLWIDPWEIRLETLHVPGYDHLRIARTRVLADVGARRSILDSYTDALEELAGLRRQMRTAIIEDSDAFMQMHRRESALIVTMQFLTPIIRTLALPYVDHPDYQQEWQP